VLSHSEETLTLGSGIESSSSNLLFKRASDFHLCSVIYMKKLSKQSGIQLLKKHKTLFTDSSVQHPTKQLLLDGTDRFIGVVDW
jgi:hypothetical protein